LPEGISGIEESGAADNSIVDQLAEEKFFEKFFGKELR
jgi:hypothetical protein